MEVKMQRTTPNELTIEVNARRNRTMSQYRVKRGGTVTFMNASKEDTLVVTPKDGWPFYASEGKSAPMREITVPPDEEVTVRISRSFAQDEFLYTARLGKNEAEDPIVIIE